MAGITESHVLLSFDLDSKQKQNDTAPQHYVITPLQLEGVSQLSQFEEVLAQVEHEQEAEAGHKAPHQTRYD